MINEQVLWFEVAMDDVEFVEVLNAGENLLEESTSILLFKAGALNDVVKELTARGVLHYQIELFWRFYDFE